MLQYSHLFDLYAGLAPFPVRRVPVHEGSWFLGIPHPRNTYTNPGGEGRQLKSYAYIRACQNPGN